MNLRQRLQGLLAIGGLLFSLTTSAAGKVALVIGNSDYGAQSLRNPVNDAEDMASTLKKLGFDVIHLSNADLQKMEEAVRSFGDRARNVDVSLFFYAGHGVQADGVNYLIPTKADIQAARDLRYKAMDVGMLLDTMQDANSKMNVVILDACRDNPFRSFRSAANRGLAGMSGPSGSIIAFATAPDNTAEDGTGRNGVYTKHLLANIQTPGMTIEDMLKKVRIGVKQETGGRQTPWENSSLSGDFCFVSCEAVASMSKEDQQKIREMEAELKKYKDVQKENEKLADEMAKLRNENMAFQKRKDDLDRIQQEKARLEQQLQSAGVDQQSRLSDLQRIQEERDRLQQQLQSASLGQAAQRNSEKQLQELQRQKEQLENEVKRYETTASVSQRDSEKQLLELQRQKERLENEVKRYEASAPQRNERMDTLEKLKADNDAKMQVMEKANKELMAKMKAAEEELTATKTQANQAEARARKTERELEAERKKPGKDLGPAPDMFISP